MTDVQTDNTAEADNEQQRALKSQLEALWIRLMEATHVIKMGGDQAHRLIGMHNAVEACSQFILSIDEFRSQQLHLPLQALRINLLDVCRGLQPEDFVPLIENPPADGDGRKVTGNRNTLRSEFLRFYCAAGMQIYMDSGMTQKTAAERVCLNMTEVHNLSSGRIIEWRDQFVSRKSTSETHANMYHSVIAGLRRHSGGKVPNAQALDHILRKLANQYRNVRLKSIRQ